MSGERTNGGALLVAERLVRRFADRAVVDGANLSLRRGEKLALVGPSGCGKTTLLQMLGLLDAPDQGSLLMGDVEPWKLGPRERAELRLRSIGFVFQNANLIEHLSARDNVALPSWRLHGSRKRALRTADEMLEHLGLLERASARAVELSTGEAQRVAVARAIVNRPALVLADEPTGSLDSRAASVLMSDFERLAADGVALLVVTHDRTLAARLGRTLQMRDGMLEEASTT